MGGLRQWAPLPPVGVLWQEGVAVSSLRRPWRTFGERALLGERMQRGAARASQRRGASQRSSCALEAPPVRRRVGQVARAWSVCGMVVTGEDD